MTFVAAVDDGQYDEDVVAAVVVVEVDVDVGVAGGVAASCCSRGSCSGRNRSSSWQGWAAVMSSVIRCKY